MYLLLVEVVYQWYMKFQQFRLRPLLHAAPHGEKYSIKNYYVLL